MDLKKWDSKIIYIYVYIYIDMYVRIPCINITVQGIMRYVDCENPTILFYLSLKCKNISLLCMFIINSYILFVLIICFLVTFLLIIQLKKQRSKITFEKWTISLPLFFYGLGLSLFSNFCVCPVSYLPRSPIWHAK